MLVSAVVDFGAYFVALFIAKLIFEIYLPGLVDGGEPSRHKSQTFIVFSIGMMVLLQIVCNCLPSTLTIAKFLPLYVVLVIYKAVPYMSIRQDSELRFLGVASVATVAVPLFLYYIFYLIVN